MTATRGWELRYRRKIFITDIAAVIVAVFGAQFIRFGTTADEFRIAPTKYSDFALTYSVVSVSLVIFWLLALSIGESRNPNVYGIGPVEYKRVINMTFLTFSCYAIIAYSTRAELGRGYFLIALPVGLFLLLFSRWLWRKRLQRQRQHHRNVYRTLIVGERTKSAHVAKEISEDRNAGFGLLGAVTEHGRTGDLLPGLPVVASYDGLITAVDELKVDTLIMTSSDSIDPNYIRHLGWQLEVRNIDLIVAVALTDVAGPRIHTRPVSGLPLIHVAYPHFTGRKQFAKRLFDLFGSFALIVLASPVMLAVAIAVKLSSKGPIFYSQERIGLNGTPFQMFKFRSMIPDADNQLQVLLDQQGTSDKPLHKIDNDPRITPVGRFIRKYSLDELPQLFNVFLGTMTLVGPRPQREAEVALYEPHHHRRLMVKPGITGLWQVSGRSNLDWEDAIRLDLYYVENWSITGDLIILLRTVKTVLKPDGAH